jgi:hypothetical protein
MGSGREESLVGCTSSSTPPRHEGSTCCGPVRRRGRRERARPGRRPAQQPVGTLRYQHRKRRKMSGSRAVMGKAVSASEAPRRRRPEHAGTTRRTGADVSPVIAETLPAPTDDQTPSIVGDLQATGGNRRARAAPALVQLLQRSRTRRHSLAGDRGRSDDQPGADRPGSEHVRRAVPQDVRARTANSRPPRVYPAARPSRRSVPGGAGLRRERRLFSGGADDSRPSSPRSSTSNSLSSKTPRSMVRRASSGDGHSRFDTFVTSPLR